MTKVIKYKEFDEACLFGPSKESGVYGVFVKLNNIEVLLYIGASKNIRNRVLKPSHHYIKLYRSGVLVYTREIITENYFDLEKSLIQKYKPALNMTLYDRN